MKTVVWVKCTGEAHSNPNIDHCFVCMPYWENIPTCPDCNGTLVVKGKMKYWCKNCKRHYADDRK